MPGPSTDQLIADFRLLRIPPNATLEEINHAYKIAAKKYHPDKHENDLKATEKMKELVAARDRLHEYLKFKPQTSSESESQSSSVAADFSRPDSVAVHYSVTSADYFEYIFKRSNVLDMYKCQLHLEEGIPLDEERIFYLVAPFRNPEDECNPYAFAENLVNSKARYIGLFTNWEEAVRYQLSADLEMTVNSGETVIKLHLKSQGYFRSGIIYSLCAIPRIVCECFTRGGLDILIPLITGYHLEKTKKMTENVSALFKELININEVDSTKLSTTLIQAKMVEKLYLNKNDLESLPRMPWIHKEIPKEAIEAFIAKKTLPLDYPSRALSATDFPTFPDLKSPYSMPAAPQYYIRIRFTNTIQFKEVMLSKKYIVERLCNEEYQTQFIFSSLGEARKSFNSLAPLIPRNKAILKTLEDLTNLQPGDPISIAAIYGTWGLLDTAEIINVAFHFTPPIRALMQEHEHTPAVKNVTSPTNNTTVLAQKVYKDLTEVIPMLEPNPLNDAYGFFRLRKPKHAVEHDSSSCTLM